MFFAISLEHILLIWAEGQGNYLLMLHFLCITVLYLFLCQNSSNAHLNKKHILASLCVFFMLWRIKITFYSMLKNVLFLCRGNEDTKYEIQHPMAYPKSKTKAEKMILEANGRKVILVKTFYVLLTTDLQGIFIWNSPFGKLRLWRIIVNTFFKL